MGIGRRAGIVPRLALAALFFALLAAPMAARAATSSFDNPADNTDAAAQQQFDPVKPHRNATPNDPGYDGSEPHDPNGVGGANFYDEQFGFFGWPSQRSRASAIYGDPP